MYNLMLSETSDVVPPYAIFAGMFSPEECARIIAMAAACGTSKGTTAGGGEDDPRRRSEVSWLYWQPAVNWIFEKLAAVARTTHLDLIPCEVRSFPEALQITRYDGERQGHYDWHKDVGSGAMAQRKLSFTVLLNPRDEFEGGNLELMSINTESHVAEDALQGTVVVFPSYELHRVSPVTKGARHSLVAWASGPRWR